jgi:chromosome segregation ATPase
MINNKMGTIDMSNARENEKSNAVKIAVLENTNFHISETLKRIDWRLDRIDGRLDRIDGRLDRMDGRLDRMDDKINQGFNSMDNRMNQGFNNMDRRIWQLFMWTLAGFGATIAGFVGMFTFMAHGFKWF